MSVELIVAVVVVIIAVVAALIAAYLTAHRLDRLHIRTDLARATLFGLLQRRHTVGAAIVRDLADRDPDSAQRLTAALGDARAHPPEAVAGHDPTPVPATRRRQRANAGDDPAAPDAEAAENRLGVVLAGVDASALPADLADELEDVTDRLSMARRFYNDAVRDTRRLREQFIVRTLHLAGRAPMPDYVELVDAPPQGA